MARTLYLLNDDGDIPEFSGRQLGGEACLQPGRQNEGTAGPQQQSGQLSRTSLFNKSTGQKINLSSRIPSQRPQRCK